MKALFLAMACLVLSAAGAGIGVLLLGGQRTVDSPAAYSALERIGDGLDELTHANDALLDRVAAIETQPAIVTDTLPVRTAVPNEADEELRRVTEELLAAMESREAPAPHWFQERVGEVVVEQRERERSERQARRDERSTQRLESRLEAMTVRLGLDKRQQSAVREVFVQQQESHAAARVQIVSGDFVGGHEAMAETGQEANDSLQGILTPVQYEAYLVSPEAQGQAHGPVGQNDNGPQDQAPY